MLIKIRYSLVNDLLFEFLNHYKYGDLLHFFCMSSQFFLILSLTLLSYFLIKIIVPFASHNDDLTLEALYIFLLSLDNNDDIKKYFNKDINGSNKVKLLRSKLM
jgi:hypothetical protein